MMDINGDVVIGLYFFLKKKLLLACIKNENISNEDLANDLNKPIIKKSNERKVHSRFIDNIWVRI